MASGRRDYTWGFLAESASEGRYTESFVQSFYASINSLSNKHLCDYTVPDSCKLALNRIAVSTDSRVPNFIEVIINNTVVAHTYFSDDYCFLFSDQNPIYVTEGQILKIIMNNLDEMPYGFYGYVIGALESLIS